MKIDWDVVTRKEARTTIGNLSVRASYINEKHEFFIRQGSATISCSEKSDVDALVDWLVSAGYGKEFKPRD